MKKMNKVNFHYFKRLARAPFILYGDFDCVLISSTGKSNFDFDFVQNSISKKMTLLLPYQMRA